MMSKSSDLMALRVLLRLAAGFWLMGVAGGLDNCWGAGAALAVLALVDAEAALVVVEALAAAAAAERVTRAMAALIMDGGWVVKGWMRLWFGMG